MIKFSDLLSVAFETDFRFINQRTVKLFVLYNDEVVSHVLSKADVILAIKKYIKCTHFYSSDPIRSEGMNYKAFKMYDLVPYFYTLINLFLTKQNDLVAPYHRFLPGLKLTCFCHLPFEDEIVIVPKTPLFVEVAKIRDNVRGSYRYLTYVDSYSYCSDNLDGLLDDIRSTSPLLFEKYDIHFTSP